MKKTILIVDDVKPILIILSSFFGDNYNVEKKSNGKEALQWMQEGNIPDLIISDINMPEMDGYEFLTHISASGIFKGIPVIILSYSDDSTDKIKCLRKGARDYIIKPFNPEELKARVENLLRLSSNGYA